jgi:hypothetical protein
MPGRAIRNFEMKAQELYDRRAAYEFCSGQDLAEFFHEQTGEMSPSGHVEIDTRAARKFVENCVKAIRHNNSGDDLGTARAIARA